MGDQTDNNNVLANAQDQTHVPQPPRYPAIGTEFAHFGQDRMYDPRENNSGPTNVQGQIPVPQLPMYPAIGTDTASSGWDFRYPPRDTVTPVYAPAAAPTTLFREEVLTPHQNFPLPGGATGPSISLSNNENYAAFPANPVFGVEQLSRPQCFLPAGEAVGPCILSDYPTPMGFPAIFHTPLPVYRPFQGEILVHPQLVMPSGGPVDAYPAPTDIPMPAHGEIPMYPILFLPSGNAAVPFISLAYPTPLDLRAALPPADNPFAGPHHFPGETSTHSQYFPCIPSTTYNPFGGPHHFLPQESAAAPFISPASLAPFPAVFPPTFTAEQPIRGEAMTNSQHFPPSGSAAMSYILSAPPAPMDIPAMTPITSIPYRPFSGGAVVPSIPAASVTASREITEALPNRSITCRPFSGETTHPRQCLPLGSTVIPNVLSASMEIRATTPTPSTADHPLPGGSSTEPQYSQPPDSLIHKKLTKM